MADGSLSKEEIDALLMGADDDNLDAEVNKASPQTATASQFTSQLSQAFLNVLAEALNKAMQETSAAATTMAGKEVQITNATLQEIAAPDMGAQVQTGGVAVESSLGHYASNLVFSFDDAAEIVKSMMGSDMLPEKMDEASLSTIAELGNTVFSVLSKNLGIRFHETLTPSTPSAKSLSDDTQLTPFRSANALKITYKLKLGESESQLQQFLDASAAMQWQQKEQSQTQPANSSGVQPMPNANNQNQQPATNSQNAVNPVNYPSFQNDAGAYGASVNMPSNIDILMDVQMVLTVELGRTKKYVKDIFQLGEGSIIELDKLAGEPVDLLVNGKLIAKGEVVVIDENFGVRVTDIVGPSERLARINES